MTIITLRMLSGTENFAIDTLAEIAFVLNMPIAELFEPQHLQEGVS